MNIYLEEDALAYAYTDNYPEVTFMVESADLDEAADTIRKRKGYASLFDWDDENIQNNGWYDFYIVIDVEKEKVMSLWAEIHGDVDEELCPDYQDNTYLEYDSDDLVRQLKKQLKERYSVELSDLKEVPA